MRLKIGKAGTILFLFLLPVVSRAATLASISTDILSMVNTFATLLVGLGLTYFFYGLGKYVADVDEKKKREAKDTMVYGIIGVFVMVSVWGIVALVRSVLGI